MSRTLAVCALFLGLLTGCANPPTHRMHDLGADFRETFIKELKALGDYKELSTAAGGSASVFSSTLTFIVTGPAAKDLDVFALGHKIRASWGKDASFPSRGAGGGGAVFSMEFGDDGEYAFVDVIGDTTPEGMTFVFLVRAIG